MPINTFTWSKKTAPSGYTGTLRHISYTTNPTLGKYCACGDYSGSEAAIITSSDGTTWVRRTSGYTGNYLLHITNNNSLWVAVGGTGTATNPPAIYVSGNGVNWASQTLSTTTQYLFNVLWDGTNFITCGHSGRVATSPDGYTWTLRTAPPGIATTDLLYRLAHNNAGRVVMGASDGRMFYSDDHGVTWNASGNSPLTTSVIPSLVNLVWNGSYFVATSNYDGHWFYANTDKPNVIITSADGYTWTKEDTFPLQKIYPPKMYAAASDGNGETLCTGYQGFSYTCTGSLGALTWKERENWVLNLGYNQSPWTRGACYDGTSYWTVGDSASICQGKYTSVTAATNPYPADAYYADYGTNTTPAPNVTLTWTGIGVGTHNVYMGTSPTTMTLKGNVGGATSYNATSLEYNMPYWWRIDIVDGGNTYVGDVWHFVTVPAAVQATDEITTFDTTLYASGSNETVNYGWTTKCTIDHANLVHGHRYYVGMSSRFHGWYSGIVAATWIGDTNFLTNEYSVLGASGNTIFDPHITSAVHNVAAGDSILYRVGANTGSNYSGLWQTYIDAIDLDSPGFNEGTDWFYVHTNASRTNLPDLFGSSTPSGCNGNGVELTFTPDGYSDYLVVGSGIMQGYNASGNTYMNAIRLRDIVTGDILFQGGRGPMSSTSGSSSDYQHTHAGNWVLKSPPRQLKTLRIEAFSQYDGSNPRWILLSSSIFVLRLNKFERYAFDTVRTGMLVDYTNKIKMPPTAVGDSPPPILRAMFTPDDKAKAMIFSSAGSTSDGTNTNSCAFRTIYGEQLSGTTAYSTETLSDLGGSIGNNDTFAANYIGAAYNWYGCRADCFGTRRLTSLSQTETPIYMFAADVTSRSVIKQACIAAFSPKYRVSPKVSTITPANKQKGVSRLTDISFRIGSVPVNPNSLNVGVRISEAWAQYYSGVNVTLRGIATSGTMWVAVGDSGTIITSNDGYNWTQRTSGTAQNLYGVAYGNGQWCVAAGNNIAVQSTDGISWSATTIGSGVDNYDVAYGAGVFVIVGASGKVETCAGYGSPWYTRTSNTTNYLRAVKYNGSMFCAVGDAGTIITSPDGVTAWTVRTSGTVENLFGVATNGSKWIATPYYYHAVLTSNNGTSWSFLETNTPDADTGFRDVAYGYGRWVLLGANNGDPVLTSIDGTTWKPTKTKGKQIGLRAAAGPNGWVMVSVGGMVFTSPYAGYNPTTMSAITNGQFRDKFSTGSSIIADGYDGYNVLIKVEPATIRKNQSIEVVIDAQSRSGISMPTFTSWFSTADGMLNVMSKEDLPQVGGTTYQFMLPMPARKFIPGHRYVMMHSGGVFCQTNYNPTYYYFIYDDNIDWDKYNVPRAYGYSSQFTMVNPTCVKTISTDPQAFLLLAIPVYSNYNGGTTSDNRIMFLDLDSDPHSFAQNSEWFLNQNFTYLYNMNDTFTSNVGASITFTPDGYSSYLIIGNVNPYCYGSGTYNLNFYMRLYDSVLGELTNCGQNSQDATQYDIYVDTSAMYIMTTPTAVSRTVSIQMKGASKWLHRNSTLLIIKLDAIKNKLLLQNLTPSTGYTTTPTTVLTGSFNPDAYNEAIVLSYMETQVSGGNTGFRQEIEFPSGTDIYLMPYAGQYVKAGEDRRGFFAAKSIYASPRTAQTLNLQTAAQSSSINLYKRNIAMFGTELYTVPVSVAKTPVPANGAIDVPLDQLLGWTAGNQAFAHKVYFGTNPSISESEYKVTQTATTYDPHPGVREYLQLATTYYWRIDEIGDSGTVTGPTWSFTTVLTMPPPTKTSNPDPAHNATGVSVDKILSWTAGDSIIETTNDVYFGTNYNNVNNGTGGTFKGNQAGTTYDPGPLNAQTLKLNGDTGYYWRVDSRNVGGATKGDIWYFTTEHVDPPTKATVPSPSNTQTQIIPDVALSWTPGTNAISHNVYFGIDPDPSGNLIGNQWTSTYDPPGDMSINQLYYWRIDEVNAGGTTVGDIWRFRTLSSLPLPTSASEPKPAMGVTGVKPDTTMSWTTGTAIPYVSPITHNIYFGTDPDPSTNFIMNTSSTTYNAGVLQYSQHYYWRIDEVNRFGGVTAGPIWDFQTAPIYVITPGDTDKVYNSVYISGATSPNIGVYAQLQLLGDGSTIADGYTTTNSLGNFSFTIPYSPQQPGTFMNLVMVTRSDVDSEEVTVLLVQSRKPITVPFTRLTRKQIADPYTVALWRLGNSVPTPLESGNLRWFTNFKTAGYTTPPQYYNYYYGSWYDWSREATPNYEPTFSNGIMTVYGYSSPAYSRISRGYDQSNVISYDTGFTLRFGWRTAHGTQFSPGEGPSDLLYYRGDSPNDEKLSVYQYPTYISLGNVSSSQWVETVSIDKYNWVNLELRVKRMTAGSGNRAHVELYVNDKLSYIGTTYNEGGALMYIGQFNTSRYYTTSDYGYMYTYEKDPFISMAGTNLQGTSARDMKFKLAGSNQAGLSFRRITAVDATPVPFDYAVYFDGTYGYLESSDSAFNITGAFTVEGWFRKGAGVTGERVIFGKNARNTSGWVVRISSDGTLQAALYSGTEQIIYSGTTILESTWYHVALSWDGSYASLYVNGTLATRTALGYVANTAQPFRVGSYSDAAASLFKGDIADVRVSSIARGSGEIYNIFNAISDPTKGLTFDPYTITVSNFGDNGGSAYTKSHTNNSTGITTIPITYGVTNLSDYFILRSVTGGTGTIDIQPTNRMRITSNVTTGTAFALNTSTAGRIRYIGDFDMSAVIYLPTWPSPVPNTQYMSFIIKTASDWNAYLQYIQYRSGSAGSYTYTYGASAWTNESVGTAYSTYGPTASWVPQITYYSIRIRRQGNMLYFYWGPNSMTPSNYVGKGSMPLDDCFIFLQPSFNTDTATGTYISEVSNITGIDGYMFQEQYPIDGYNTTFRSSVIQSKAKDFNGTTAYLQYQDNVAWDHYSFTSEMWFQADAYQDAWLISRQNNDVNAKFYLRTNTSGTLTATINNTVGESLSVTGGNYVPGAWHYVVFTFDAASKTLSLYLDGISIGHRTLVSVNNSYTSNLPIDIGRNQATLSGYFNGAIASIRFSRIARTSKEIFDIYNGSNIKL